MLEMLFWIFSVRLLVTRLIVAVGLMSCSYGLRSKRAEQLCSGSSTYGSKHGLHDEQSLWLRVMDVNPEDKMVFRVPEARDYGEVQGLLCVDHWHRVLTVTSSAIYAACPLRSYSHTVAASSSASTLDRTPTHSTIYTGSRSSTS